MYQNRLLMHLFKRKYNDLYNSVSYDSARMDILKQTLETRISMNSFSNCLYCQSHYVTTDEVKRKHSIVYISIVSVLL